MSVVITLLGYLLIQAVALRLRRLWRRRFDQIAGELTQDAFLPLPHWRKVEFYKRASRGGWATLRRFARTPERMFRVERSRLIRGTARRPIRS